MSGCNSVGRVLASQARCRGFEPRHPLQIFPRTVLSLRGFHLRRKSLSLRGFRLCVIPPGVSPSAKGSAKGERWFEPLVFWLVPLGWYLFRLAFLDCPLGAIRAGVAQLARALPCQGRGREFESLRPLHTIPPGVSPPVKDYPSGGFTFGERLSLRYPAGGFTFGERGF